METVAQKTLIQGIGDEVIWGILALAIVIPLLILGLLRWRHRQIQTIHPESQQEVADARLHIPLRRSVSSPANECELPNGSMLRLRRNDDTQCPICLSELQYAIETNCGHVFCGQCMIMYWRHGIWLGPVRCPVCRQFVTIFLPSYSEAELNTEVEAEVQERTNINNEINHYNRRFSGEPRPLIDYIRELPTLLRHLWNEFFSVGGLMYMFRIRIILCFFAACMYLISPLDIIPEAVFGILGLFDDMFVVLLLAIYISIIYRRFIANRAQNAVGVQ